MLLSAERAVHERTRKGALQDGFVLCSFVFLLGFAFQYAGAQRLTDGRPPKPSHQETEPNSARNHISLSFHFRFTFVSLSFYFRFTFLLTSFRLCFIFVLHSYYLCFNSVSLFFRLLLVKRFCEQRFVDENNNANQTHGLKKTRFYNQSSSFDVEWITCFKNRLGEVLRVLRWSCIQSCVRFCLTSNELDV